MRNPRFFGLILMVLVVLLGSSCSKFRKIQKSTDWKAKYAAAVAYYEEEEYYKASVLLDQVLPIIKGTVDGEKATFLRAYSYYHQGQYILSASYFKDFYTVYSRSEYAIEAMYLHAHSLYLQSPTFSLDQTSTFEAIDAFQIFLNKYPYSDYSPKATTMIDELQRKLEKKNFENAKHYYKLERWEAARVAFETFEDEFPDSALNEEVLYLAIDAEFSYAKASIRSRQKERFEKTIELYERFVDKYPESKFLKDAQARYDQSISQLKRL